MDNQTLTQLENIIKKALTHVATNEDLKKFATKDDLIKLREDITDDITKVVKGFAETLDEKKANKTAVHLLRDKLEQVERKVTSH